MTPSKYTMRVYRLEKPYADHRAVLRDRERMREKGASRRVHTEFATKRKSRKRAREQGTEEMGTHADAGDAQEPRSGYSGKDTETQRPVALRPYGARLTAQMLGIGLAETEWEQALREGLSLHFNGCLVRRRSEGVYEVGNCIVNVSGEDDERVMMFQAKDLNEADLLCCCWYKILGASKLVVQKRYQQGQAWMATMPEERTRVDPTIDVDKIVVIEYKGARQKWQVTTNIDPDEDTKSAELKFELVEENL